MKTLKRTAIMISVMFTLVLGGAAPTIPANIDAHAKTTYVWIAPRYGKRYHYQRRCWGLKRAGHHVRHVTLHWARSHGYTRCRIKSDVPAYHY
nr:hypothetical protein [Lentilactobacillus hilgardii]